MGEWSEEGGEGRGQRGELGRGTYREPAGERYLDSTVPR